MFESKFYVLGKKVSKKRNKILVVAFWIALFVLMAPSALGFFNNVNYNFGNNMIPSNSQSYQANELMTQQFGSRSGNSSGQAQIVIVVTGVNLNDSSNVNKLITMENNLSAYYSNTSFRFAGFEDFFSVEKTMLQSSAAGIKTLENSTFYLLSATNSNLYALISGVNSSAYFEFGLPATYLQNFSTELGLTGNLTKSEGSAYNNTSLAASGSGNPLAISYVNNFTNKWNSTVYLGNPAGRNGTMNNAINATVSPVSGWGSFALVANSQFEYLLISLSQNETLHQFMSPSFNQSSFNNNYSITTVAGQLQANYTIQPLLSSGLNISSYSLVYAAYNLTAHPLQSVINDSMLSLVRHGMISSFDGNPLIQYTPGYFSPFLGLVYRSQNLDQSVNEEMNNSVGHYPLLPSPYVFHQFIGYSWNSMILVASFSNNFNYGLVTHTSSLINPALSTISGSKYYMAGNSAFTSQLSNQIVNGLVVALVAGVLLSFLIVGVFFRSPIAALIPFAFFLMSAVIGMGINGLLYTYVFHASASFLTPTLLLILILGLTTDYVVYMMARFRKELVKKNPDAVAETTKWAGHAVFTSGATVSLSYLVLWITNVPFFSDSGITNAIGISVSILLAITMLGAVMALLNHRMFWPSHPEKYAEAPFEKGMNRLGRAVVKNKKKILAAMVVITFAGTYLYAITPTNMDIYDLLPNNSEIQALVAVNQTFHGDYFDRGYVVMEMQSPIMTNNSGNYSYNNTELSIITAVEQKILADKNFSQVYGPTFPYGYYTNLSGVPGTEKITFEKQINSYIGNNTKYAVVYFQTAALAYRPQTSVQVKNLDSLIASVDHSNSFNFYVGGLTQTFNDMYTSVVNSFDFMIPVLAISIFAILFIQLGSAFTPIRLILMVMAAAAVSLALTFILFFYLFSTYLIVFLPMFVFVTLLAVGVDYDIFMITRVREEITKGSTTEEAIVKSITESGGVIITLGAILFVTFGALYLGGIPILQEIGIGLALGVLFDTFVSWPFFLPVVMMYLKKYNWWPTKLVAK